MFDQLASYTGPADLIPATWTPDVLFGGVASILSNPALLAAMSVVVALAIGPKVFRKIKGVITR
jgi:hypothetical protein